MAILPRPFAAPAQGSKPDAQSPTESLRRCTFRKVTLEASSRALPVYEVACTFPDRKRAISLGDIESARPICQSCTYQGIFRADAD